MKILLPFSFLLLISFHSRGQCTDPVFSFFQDFSDPVFVMTPDPPECWTETQPLQTAYNTGAMRIFGAHNGDPQGMVITQELFNVRGILTFKAKKGQSFFNLPGDGISVGVIDDNGVFIDLFPFTYESTEATYTFDFSTYTGTGNRIAFARTGINKKVISITDISYTSACDPGVTALAQDITISLDELGNAIITPQQVDDGSTDFCNNPALLSIDRSTFTCDDLGPNTVTLTAEDTFGTTGTATATVTVEPHIGIQVKTEQIMVELDGSGSVMIDELDLVEQSSATCGTISLSLDQSSFDCSDVGDLTVTITATHSTGSTSSATKMITIVDNTAPVVSVNSMVNLSLDANSFTADLTVPMVELGSTDNCGIVSQTLSKMSFTCEDVGENLVTYIVSDAEGNQAESTITVTVTSPIVDETVSTSASNEYCPSGSNPGGTITTGGSVAGVNYFLRNSADNSVIDGPIVGTGGSLSFSTGSVDGTETFNVFAEKKKTGSALDFDGINDYVDLGTDHRDILKEITVAIWIKTSFSGASNFISGKYNGITGYLMYIDANGKAGFDGRDGGGYKQAGASTTSVNDGQWHLVTGTINLNTGEWKLYVDGALESSTTYGPGSTLSNSASMLFGAHTTLYFTGQIDQFAVYNQALDANGVGALASSCLTGAEAGLVGLYNLDEGSGTTATDLSSKQINGVMTNMDESTDWITGDLACDVLCEFQMSTEVTFGDNEAPQLIAQNVTIQLDSKGEGSITAASVDNGSSDNCTSPGNLVFSFSQSTFGCDEVGDNTVTVTVMDEAGNESSSNITVAVLSPIVDQIPVATSSGFCAGESTTVSIPGSQSGIDYFLRKSTDNSVVDGPIAGTGGSLDFSTGSLTETTDFNVTAKFGGGPGTSLRFDGTNDHINTDVEIPVTSAMTIEAWIFPLGGLTNTIMTNSNHAGTGSTNLEAGEFWFNTTSNTGGDGLTFTYIADNGVAATHSRQNILTFNQWNHVAVVFDGSTGIANMYANGIALTTTITAGTTTQMGRTGSDLNIGKRHGGSGSKFFNGYIDEVRVWSSVRTAQELADNKDVCLTGSESELIAYFDFEEGTGGSIADQVAGGTGTLVNFDTNTAWVDGAVGCVDVCEVEMSTEVTVEINDAPPVVSAKDITIQLGSDGTATITPLHVENGSSDDCSTQSEDLEFALSQTAFSCADIGDNTLIFTVTDQAGNASTANVTVTVEDSPPNISANDVILTLDATGNATLTTESVNNGTVDDCSTAITYALSKTNFTCFDLGDNAVTFTATDEQGNSSVETVTVTVQDDTPPTVSTFLTVDAELDASGNVIVDPSDIVAGSSDNCSSNLILSLSESEFDCSHIGANNVIFTAADASGNEVTSSITINVVDNLAPSAIAKSIEVRLDQNNSVIVLPEDVSDGSSDNCGNVTMALEKESGGNSVPTLGYAAAPPAGSISFTEDDLGANSVTLTVIDDAGNSSTANATITVLEFKTAQTITFGTLASKVYGDSDFDLSASASSGLSVEFSVLSGPATISGQTVSILGAGTVTIAANQSGDDFYSPAVEVLQTFVVERVLLTATADNKSILYGDQIPELTISYDGFVNGDDPASLDGEPSASVDVSGIVDAGAYDITLSGGSSENYNLELNNGILTVNKVDQVITLTPIGDKEPTADPFDVIATVNSDLTLTYEVAGPATISGTTVTLDGTEGEVTITVLQEGDLNHNSASVSETINVRVPLGTDFLDETIKIYPNPVVNYFMVESSEDVELRLLTQDGKLSKSFFGVRGRVSVEDLVPGVYILEISKNDQRTLKRIIKTN